MGRDNTPVPACSVDGCSATIVPHMHGAINAHNSGWFFMKNGRAYCPEHKPEWVDAWRKRQEERSSK